MTSSNCMSKFICKIKNMVRTKIHMEAIYRNSYYKWILIRISILGWISMWILYGNEYGIYIEYNGYLQRGHLHNKNNFQNSYGTSRFFFIIWQYLNKLIDYVIILYSFYNYTSTQEKDQIIYIYFSYGNSELIA